MKVFQGRRKKKILAFLEQVCFVIEKYFSKRGAKDSVLSINTEP
jgi:hypothetical protein